VTYSAQDEGADPLQRTQQGSGQSPAIWTIICVLLLKAFSKIVTGIRVFDLIANVRKQNYWQLYREVHRSLKIRAQLLSLLKWNNCIRTLRMLPTDLKRGENMLLRKTGPFSHSLMLSTGAPLETKQIAVHQSLIRAPVRSLATRFTLVQELLPIGFHPSETVILRPAFVVESVASPYVAENQISTPTRSYSR
jgi:hypothetical protein